MKEREKKAMEKYNEACEELAEAVNQHLFNGCRTFYWVGDGIGGVCDYEDEDFLTVADMVLILEHGMTYGQYAEWRDANIDNEEFIGLHSWLLGLRHMSLKQPPMETTKNN